jgi:hypothetical protein
MCFVSDRAIASLFHQPLTQRAQHQNMNMPNLIEAGAPVVDRYCLRPPIPEIVQAAQYLDDAVTAYINGHRYDAEELIAAANIQSVYDWAKSIVCASSSQTHYRKVGGAPTRTLRKSRGGPHMPNAAAKKRLLQRDGYHCRFCRIPVIRAEVRNKLRKHYEQVLPWGTPGQRSHAAFVVMWAQYDHLLPFSRGGNTDDHNMVIACGPCTFGRGFYTLEEVGVADPREREPVHDRWDGLERMMQ